VIARSKKDKLADAEGPSIKERNASGTAKNEQSESKGGGVEELKEGKRLSPREYYQKNTSGNYKRKELGA